MAIWMPASVLRFGCFIAFFKASLAQSPDRFSSRAEPFLGRVAATRPEISVHVEEVLSSNYRADTDEHLKTLRDELRPTFAALPKNERGLLGAPATRYLLHRHFRRSRGWLVNGIAPDGGAWNQTLPTVLLRSKTPGSVAELFEQRLLLHGLDLSEAAVLTAMIENQVHKDTVARLRTAWLAQELPLHGKVGIPEVELVLDTYMMGYILHNEAYMQPKHVALALGEVEDTYPKWNSTRAFVRAMLRRSAPHHVRELSFQDVEHVIVEISENYAQQTDECKDIKLSLLALEGSRPGRVHLQDFFRSAVYDGDYHFGESVEYMRKAGLLDGSSVVVPNYIDSPSQVVADSEDYSVVCLDGCEVLMDKLERGIAGPYATAEQITSLISVVGSESQAPWVDRIPAQLQKRLQWIADFHGGEVPLHGRLFAQWLHHAYPRDCPYPHVAGSTMPLDPNQYVEKFGGAATATDEEMKIYADAEKEEEDTADLPWDMTEELLAPRTGRRFQLLPDRFVPWVQCAGCITVLAMLLPNLALIQLISSPVGSVDKVSPSYKTVQSW